MSIKDDFTAEEWTSLLQTPMLAGMSIISSDIGITSVPKETAALIRAMLENPVPAGAEDLVGGLVADLKAKNENAQAIDTSEFDTKDPAEAKAKISSYISDTAAMLDGKLSASASAAYKEWVYGVAVSVANAGKEGGFLGIGAQRVSKQEEAALADLRSDLGLPAA